MAHNAQPRYDAARRREHARRTEALPAGTLPGMVSMAACMRRDLCSSQQTGFPIPEQLDAVLQCQHRGLSTMERLPMLGCVFIYDITILARAWCRALHV